MRFGDNEDYSILGLYWCPPISGNYFGKLQCGKLYSDYIGVI